MVQHSICLWGINKFPQIVSHGPALFDLATMLLLDLQWIDCRLRSVQKAQGNIFESEPLSEIFYG